MSMRKAGERISPLSCLVQQSCVSRLEVFGRDLNVFGDGSVPTPPGLSYTHFDPSDSFTILQYIHSRVLYTDIE